MITIFCNFGQFSAKKIGVFIKKQCYDQNFSKFSFVLSQKSKFFAIFFEENILKLITSVPGNLDLGHLFQREEKEEGDLRNASCTL
jgi:hypothetical protein